MVERFRGFSEALVLCLGRGEAEKDGDYARADAIHHELCATGVRIDESRSTFRTRSGVIGSYLLHRGIIGFEDVRLMCLDREEARRENYYQEADDIRGRLLDMGIVFDDKAHVFTMPDGAKGSYDLYQFEGRERMPPWRGRDAGQNDAYSEVKRSRFDAARDAGRPRSRHYEELSWSERRRPPTYRAREATDREPFEEDGNRRYRSQSGGPPPPPPPPRRHMSAGVVAHRDERFEGYLDTLNLALQREELRREGDYEGADEVRSELNQRGAVLNDTTHMFTLRSLVGSYNLQEGITAREIQHVALEREEARRDREYERGDLLRHWLTDHEVRVDDTAHTFRCGDGIVGSYDLYKWQPVFSNGQRAERDRSRSPRRLRRD